MLGLIIRALFVLAGLVTSLFVTRDALHFDVVQMAIGILLFTLSIAIIAFWPMLKDWIRRIRH